MLHLAARDGEVTALTSLLADAAEDVDARDAAGRTPLYEAADHGHLEVVRALLAAGADRSLGWNGQTPAYRAAARGEERMAQLLEHRSWRGMH